MPRTSGAKPWGPVEVHLNARQLHRLSLSLRRRDSEGRRPSRFADGAVQRSLLRVGRFQTPFAQVLQRRRRRDIVSCGGDPATLKKLNITTAETLFHGCSSALDVDGWKPVQWRAWMQHAPPAEFLNREAADEGENLDVFPHLSTEATNTAALKETGTVIGRDKIKISAKRELTNFHPFLLFQRRIFKLPLLKLRNARARVVLKTRGIEKARMFPALEAMNAKHYNRPPPARAPADHHAGSRAGNVRLRSRARHLRF